MLLFSRLHIWKSVGLAVVLQLALGSPAQARMLSLYDGEYSGYEPSLLARGLTAIQAKLKLRVTEEGFELSSIPNPAGQVWQYKYSGSWIDEKSPVVRSQNSLTQKCFGLLDRLESKVIRFILCLDLLAIRRGKATLFPVGQGPIASTAFLEDSTTAEDDLSDPLPTPSMNTQLPALLSFWSPYYHELPIIDFDQKLADFDNGDQRHRIQILKEIAPMLWARSKEEVNGAVEIIKAGLSTSDEMLQVLALDVFLKGGTVPESALVIQGILENPSYFYHPDSSDPQSRSDFLIRRAVAAAGDLIAHVTDIVRARYGLSKKYGTHNLDEIFKYTQGHVDAEDRRFIELLMRESSARWQNRHRIFLLKGLMSALNNKAIPQDLRDQSLSILAAKLDPQLFADDRGQKCEIMFITRIKNSDQTLSDH